jgi:pimeloyl-ACP methyl ester carboxylesterase
MEFVIYALILLAVLLAAVLMGAFYAYRKAFYHRNNRHKPDRTYTNEEPYHAIREKLKSWTDALAAVPFEPVTIRSNDGKRLFGRYYHVADGAPLYIEFHGYKGTAFRDFSGGDPFARRQGSNTLLVDQRAHGDSDGHTITFGILERLDCLEWVKYAVDRFGKDQKILLSGISMGAATVLMASDLPLPPNVVGIIADSPYSSPKEILMKVCRVDMGLPARALYPLLFLGARLFGHFGIEGGAIESVQHTKIPLLILHGESDGFVPMEMSRRIADAAASEVTLVTFKNADHCLGYVIHPQEYEEALHAFINRCLGA